MADLSGAWSLNQITESLSVLAEACLRIAVSALLREAAAKGDWTISNPENPEENSGLIILAMGKLGARELNYSSDIDLIALYDAENAPYTGKRDIGAFFVKPTRALVAMMEEQTPQGYVFRTIPVRRRLRLARKPPLVITKALPKTGNARRSSKRAPWRATNRRAGRF